MVAGHRLVVGCSHDDTKSISCFRVLGIVCIESPTPHGRPQHVTFQSENQLKHLAVEVMVTITCAEGILYPCRQTGRLIVEEKATKLHSWFAIGKCAR